MSALSAGDGSTLDLLRHRIADLEATLHAIREGGVDAVVLGSGGEEQVYTLTSADRPYRLIIEQMGEGAATVSERGVLLYANARFAALLGRPRGALVGCDLTALLPIGPVLAELLGTAAGATRRAELELPRPDGSSTPVLVSVSGLEVEDVLVRCLLVTDLSAYRQSEEQFAAAFDNAPVGMGLVSSEGLLLRVNGALERLTGRSAEELTGSRLASLLDERDVDTTAPFSDFLTGALPAFQAEVRLTSPDGSSRWAALSASMVAAADPPYAVVQFEDLDERKQYEGRLQYLADHDALTGLLNRRRFHEDLTRQVALDARYGGASSVVLLDLDNFKLLNDTLGHSAGDRVIQAVARSMRAGLRDTDVLGRLGGDEFAVLLPGTDLAEASVVTDVLLARVRANVLHHAGQRLRSTASAGVALLREALDADDVLAHADLAMYAAKEAGRDTRVVYDPEAAHVARAHARYRWIERIRNALEDDLFTLYEQPILDLRTGSVEGSELLLRMRDKTGPGVVGPDHFLYIAERHGLVGAIDRVVIPLSMALAARSGRPPSFRWEINLSAESLGDQQVPALIESCLEETGLPPASFVFEITETAAIANIDHAVAFATRIGAIGCKFALDDFGAGYGSFYYLKHIPCEYLKIDGEFIRGLTRNDTDRVIVDAVVTAAHRLGKQTVAEYVGDEETLRLLRVLEVDHAQGYHVGAPVAPAGAP